MLGMIHMKRKRQEKKQIIPNFRTILFIQELIRLEEEKLRATARREAQQRRVRERPRAMGLTSGFLEGYESGKEGGGNIAKK